MENEPKSRKGRYPKGHPREGGFCVLWAKQTLASEKLRNPMVAGCFFKVLCVAQLIDYETGVMARSDMPISAITIANKAGITGEQFNRLVDMDLIQKKAVNGEVIFSIKSWFEHQNPKIAEQVQNKLPLNGNAHTPAPYTNHHSPTSGNRHQRAKKSNSEYESKPSKTITSE